MRVPLKNIKMNKYGTRHLEAGDTFDASVGHARLLVRLGKVEYVLKEQPVPVTPPEPTAEVEQLRQDYETLAGKKPHHMWRVPRLKAEIDRLTAPTETQ